MKPLHILIIEDNPISQMITAAMLRALEAETSVACGVTEAREKLRANRYDAVLMDSQLPDGCGLELAREYLQQGGDIPVIAMTGASDSSTHRDDCLAAGMVAYLEKPFTLRQLEEALVSHAMTRCQ